IILPTPEWEEHICTPYTPLQRLAEEAQAQQACPSRSTIPECYRDFTDVFSEEAFAHLPPHKAWDHAIELHPDAKLPRGRTFPLSPTEQKELDKFLRENLANAHICCRWAKNQHLPGLGGESEICIIYYPASYQGSEYKV